MSAQYWFMLPIAPIIATTAMASGIGAQLGALVANRIPQRILERSLAILFILVALLTVGEVVL